MSPTQPITLYDISSSLHPQAWSPNTWKARIVLNYKRIPYKTEWVSFPDIAALAKKLGCSPTRKQGREPLYTLPIIVDNDGNTPVAVCDSLEIAKYLDAKFPDRPVLPKKGLALDHAFEHCFMHLVGRDLSQVIMPIILNALDDRGKAYYIESRERWYGKKIDDTTGDRNKIWETIEEGLDKLASVLDQNGPGSEFVAGGSEPTRADLVLISYIAFIHAIAPEGWARLKDKNGGRWQRLWELSEEWRVVL